MGLWCCRGSIIHLIFGSDVKTLRAVINNPFYTPAPRTASALVYPCDFLGRAKVTPPAVLFSFRETCTHVVCTGCFRRPRLFLSQFVLRSEPGCYYTLHMHESEDGNSHYIHLTARTTKSVSYTNPAPADASLRSNRISASFCPRDEFPPLYKS